MGDEKKHMELSHPLLVQIGAVADELGREVYVVGGYVRDSLLGVDDKDRLVVYVLQ